MKSLRTTISGSLTKLTAARIKVGGAAINDDVLGTAQLLGGRIDENFRAHFPGSHEMRVASDETGGLALFIFGGFRMESGWSRHAGLFLGIDKTCTLYLHDLKRARAGIHSKTETSTEALWEAVDVACKFINPHTDNA